MSFGIQSAATILKNELKKGKRKKGELDADTRRYAAFASTAYVRKRGDRVSRLQKYLGESNDGFTLNEDLSSKHQTVWVNDDRKEVVTAFRGTDPKDRNDLHTDLHIAVGMEKHSNRFKKTEKQYRQVLDQYDDYKHILSSHSLGATLNTRMAEVYKDEVDEVHNFSPGSSVNAVLSGVRASIKKEDNSHIHSYYAGVDPISMMGKFDSSHTTHMIEPLKGTVNHHSLNQFLE